MIPTPITQGTQGPVVGTVQLVVDDPNGEVAGVEFYVTGGDGILRGPFGEDRRSGTTYERDILLSRQRCTRVQPKVVLVDGTVVDATPAMFGVRFEPIGKTPANFTQCTVSASSGGVLVQQARDTNASSWRLWAAPGKYPTNDGTPVSGLDDCYLRYDSAVDDPHDLATVTFGAVSGTWYVIAAPYNVFGQQGARVVQSVEVA